MTLEDENDLKKILFFQLKYYDFFRLARLLKAYYRIACDHKTRKFVQYLKNTVHFAEFFHSELIIPNFTSLTEPIKNILSLTNTWITNTDPYTDFRKFMNIKSDTSITLLQENEYFMLSVSNNDPMSDDIPSIFQGEEWLVRFPNVDSDPYYIHLNEMYKNAFVVQMLYIPCGSPIDFTN